MWHSLLLLLLGIYSLLLLHRGLCRPVCTVGDLADIEDGDLILYLHADYIVNPLKWLINSILVHKNFSHVGVAWRDPETNSLFVLEQTYRCYPVRKLDRLRCSMHEIADRSYNGHMYYMKRGYPRKIALTRREVHAQLERFRYWYPPRSTLQQLRAGLHAMRIREPAQRHEVWCTEWVGHIQSMYDNVSDATFILSMRCLLKKYGSEELHSIWVDDSAPAGTD